jgi:hypothetical protein
LNIQIQSQSPGIQCYFKLQFDLNDYASKNGQNITVANPMQHSPAQDAKSQMERNFSHFMEP